MAVAVTSVAPLGMAQAPHPKPPGDVFTKLYFATGDNSYPTGGYPIGAVQLPDPALLLEGVDVVGFTGTTGAVEASYNYATGKLQFFQNSGAETANTTNVSTAVATLRVWFR